MASDLVGLTVFFVLVGVLFAMPVALYAHDARRGRGSDDYLVTALEQEGLDPYRGRVARQIERAKLPWTARAASGLGYFLGAMGFLWTIPVLLGAAAFKGPMILLGLPGLVVSYSVFFVARAVLRSGPKASGFALQVGALEAVHNLWLLVLMAAVNDEGPRAGVSLALDSAARLFDGDASRGLGSEIWTMPYKMSMCGSVSLLYALVSLAHAGLLLHAGFWLRGVLARQIAGQAAEERAESAGELGPAGL